MYTEDIMSRSIKHVKTTGFLEKFALIRKNRQAQRELKEQLLNDTDYANNLIFAQEL